MRPETALDIETLALADRLIFRLAVARGLAWLLAGERVGPAQPDVFRSASHARPRVAETGEGIKPEKIGREIVFGRVRDLVRGLRFAQGHCHRHHQAPLVALESPALAAVLAALGAGGAQEEVRARGRRLAAEVEQKGLVMGEGEHHG